MIFDSEKQKRHILRIVLESRVEMSIGELLSGPSKELLELVMAIRDGTVIFNPDEQDEKTAR
jgi:hypothetical protein